MAMQMPRQVWQPSRPPHKHGPPPRGRELGCSTNTLICHSCSGGDIGSARPGRPRGRGARPGHVVEAWVRHKYGPGGRTGMKTALRVTSRESPMLTRGSTLTPVSFSRKSSPVFRAQLGGRETWSPDLALSLESCHLVVCFVLGDKGLLEGQRERGHETLSTPPGHSKPPHTLAGSV